jgi:hypothetical protein
VIRPRVFVALLAVLAAAGAVLLLRPVDPAPPEDAPPAVPAERPPADPLPSSAGRVTVHVVDATGSPIAGATVEVQRTGDTYPVWDPRWFADGSGGGGPPPFDVLRPTFPRRHVGESRTDARGIAVFVLPVDAKYEVALQDPKAAVVAAQQVHLLSDDPDAFVRLWPVRARSLRVRLRDSRGQPVAGVGVEPAWAGDAGWLLHPTSESGQPAGEVRIGMLEDEDAAFDVAVPERRASGRWQVRDPGLGRQTIDLTWPSEGSIVGRVLDESGRPVARADVRVGIRTEVVESLLYWTAEATTDAEGSYRMADLPPGTVHFLRATAPGSWFRDPLGHSAPVRIEAGRPLVWDVPLRRGSAIEGRVVQSQNGESIADAHVVLQALDTSGWKGAWRAVSTGPSGSFTFSDLPPGRYTLRVRHADWFSASLVNAYATAPDTGTSPSFPLPHPLVTLVEGNQKAEVEIRLDPRRTLSGRVETADGRPVAMATIGLRAPIPRERVWDWRRHPFDVLGRTAEDGTFRIACPVVGEPWALVARSAGEVAVVRDPLRPRTESGLVLRFEPRTTLVARLTDEDGRDRGGVAVEATGTRPAISGPDGVVRLDLPARNVRTAQSDGEGPAGRSAPTVLRLAAIGESVPATVIPSVFRTTGVLVDESNRAFAGTDFHARIGRLQTRVHGKTDSNGSFALWLPKGPARLVVSSRGTWETVEASPRVEGGSEGATYRAARVPERVGKLLRVTVLDPEGRRVPGCRVIAASDRPYRPFEGGALDDDVVGGETRLEVFGDAPWAVHVFAPADREGRPLPLRPAIVSVARPDDPVVVRLEPGSEIRGRVVDGDGRGVAGARVAERYVSRFAAWTDAAGNYAIPGPPPSEEITLRVDPPSSHQAPDDQVAVAGSPGPVFHLERAGVLTGRVLHPDGDALLDAEVAAEWKGARKALRSKSIARTDETGAFRLTGVPTAGTVRLTIEAPNGIVGVRKRTIWADVAVATDPLPITLARGVSFAGTLVRTDGTPIPRGRVDLRLPDAKDDLDDPSERTDADGDFRFDGLEAGAYWLRVRSDAYVALADRFHAVAPAESERVMLPVARMSGRVEGATEPGWNLQLRPTVARAEDRHGSASVSIGARGAFALDVRTDREYRLFAWNEKGDDRFLLSGAVSAGALVPLLLAEGGFLEGTIEDEAGAPTPHAELQARHSPDRWELSARSDAQGKFRFRGVPPGDWTVQLKHRWRTSTAHRVPTNSSGIVVRPRPR